MLARPTVIHRNTLFLIAAKSIMAGAYILMVILNTNLIFLHSGIEGCSDYENWFDTIGGNCLVYNPLLCAHAATLLWCLHRAGPALYEHLTEKDLGLAPPHRTLLALACASL